MRTFSKSKLLALRQCPKRLWLELNRPELRADSSATETGFQIGHQVGDMARQIYDPDQRGAMIDVGTEGFSAAFARTQTLLAGEQTIFEAGFSWGGALSFADVMVPEQVNGKKVWRMVEVKSSTSVKDYYRDDAAIQAFVARGSGTPLHSIALAHIDNNWVYPGNGDYRGLLVENDLTEEAFSRSDEVRDWIAQAQRIDARVQAPAITTGDQCKTPYTCGFYDHCCSQEPQAEFPLHWLPRIGSSVVNTLVGQGITDLRQVPHDVLNEKQRRVQHCTATNTVFFDAEGAAADLATCGLPAYFLDFESIQFAIPLWARWRPYRQAVFQFSLHVLNEQGQLAHQEYLDLSGNDPTEPLARALVAHCGTSGPVYVYNAAFECGRIQEMMERFAHDTALVQGLAAIVERIVDLLPIARERYYHPAQQGSWSLKKVLPAVVPSLRYDTLDGVQDGGMAQDAYLEATHPQTSKERTEALRAQLLAYCKLDTYATVRLWQVFANRGDLSL